MGLQIWRVFFPVVGLYILKCINTNFLSGGVAGELKHVLLDPFLKKPALDTSTMANFRPVSKLPFLSKILEKLDHTPLMGYLNDLNIF